MSFCTLIFNVAESNNKFSRKGQPTTDKGLWFFGTLKEKLKKIVNKNNKVKKRKGVKT